MCESLNRKQLDELYEHYESALKTRKLSRELLIPIWFDGYFVEY